MEQLYYDRKEGKLLMYDYFELSGEGVYYNHNDKRCFRQKDLKAIRFENNESCQNTLSAKPAYERKNK